MFSTLSKGTSIPVESKCLIRYVERTASGRSDFGKQEIDILRFPCRELGNGHMYGADTTTGKRASVETESCNLMLATRMQLIVFFQVLQSFCMLCEI